MTSPVQVAANKRNAQKSTGPRTLEGKKRSSKNALSHGLRSELPVIPGEDPAAWEEYRNGILRDLKPVGPLATALANRVALALWRLRRSAWFETAVTVGRLAQVEEEHGRVSQKEYRRAPDKWNRAADRDEVDPSLTVKLARAENKRDQTRQTIAQNEVVLAFLEKLPQLPEEAQVSGEVVKRCFLEDFGDFLAEEVETPVGEGEAFLATLGVPKERHGDPCAWTGWTAGMVRKGLSLFAKTEKMKLEGFLELVLADIRRQLSRDRGLVRDLDGRVRTLRKQVEAQIERLRAQRLLPDENTLEKLIRYETHAGRQLIAALHALERLQTAGTGTRLPPTAAVEVNFQEIEALPFHTEDGRKD